MVVYKVSFGQPLYNRHNAILLKRNRDKAIEYSKSAQSDKDLTAMI